MLGWIRGKVIQEHPLFPEVAPKGKSSVKRDLGSLDCKQFNQVNRGSRFTEATKATAPIALVIALLHLKMC